MQNSGSRFIIHFLFKLLANLKNLVIISNILLLFVVDIQVTEFWLTSSGDCSIQIGGEYVMNCVYAWLKINFTASEEHVGSSDA